MKVAILTFICQSVNKVLTTLSTPNISLDFDFEGTKPRAYLYHLFCPMTIVFEFMTLPNHTWDHISVPAVHVFKEKESDSNICFDV